MVRLRLPDLDRLEPGASQVVAHPEGKPPWRSVIVVRTPKGALRAFWNVCKHLPVPLDGGLGSLPVADRLVCSTHGASFRLEDGRCVAGPSMGSRLDALSVQKDTDGWFVEATPPGD